MSVASGEAPTGNPREWDAATYDRVSDPMTRWGAGVLERLELDGDEVVLDAGCGTGRVTQMLLERLPRGRVIAFDASESMLEEARRRFEDCRGPISFVHGDLLELSLDSLGESAPLDGVLSTATFHWVLDHDKLFDNIASVLRPGGQLVAQCGAHGNITRLLEAVRKVGHERKGTWVYATPEETTARLERSGFSDIQVWTNPEPTRLEAGEPLESYLETVCLRSHVAAMTESEKRSFLRSVAGAMDEPVIDYVRLNIVARRS
jgi:trans-aconitate 2-methyltransferase